MSQTLTMDKLVAAAMAARRSDRHRFVVVSPMGQYLDEFGCIYDAVEAMHTHRAVIVRVTDGVGVVIERADR